MTSTGAVARNWAGNVTFGAARLHRPETVDELRRVVAEGRRVRVLGSGHSFNLIADTDGDLVRVDALPRVFEPDEAASTVTVSAGMLYGEVAAALHERARALANMASLPHISVYGSVATGTHGSGDRQPGLADSVTAVRLIGPGGEPVELSRERDPERFGGAVVNLGALGVVTEVTLRTEPTFEVAQWVQEDVPLDTVVERFDEVFGVARSVSVFTDWAGTTGTAVLKMRTDAPGGGAHPGADWMGGRPADKPWHPVPGMPAEHCTVQNGVPGPWHERLPHFRPEFTPSRGDELQSEIFVPRTEAVEAIARLRELGERMAPVLLISEIRTVAADAQWLSPTGGRDSVAFHFTWRKDPEAVVPVIAEMEQRLLPLDARVHWGKVSGLIPAAIGARYERLPDFRRLVADHDPDGVFRNTYLDDLLAEG
ncbi:alditol oxidase [Streptomyces calidiresistens]|uniref:FAD-binding protein n=1 Tax=Streptomyces calidiresistens TaxID=1485586 RepID=A0A7W3XUV6_9ACTN|nr:FAD-binding protein [Streptomyces calidiresistens]MBB0228320.1 FAD-binding protein [Streptomyces calidiresistens]